MKISFDDFVNNFKICKSAMPGYIFQHLQDVEGDPPLTAAGKAYGTLTHGFDRPNLILSSEDMMKFVMRKIVEDQIYPVMHGYNFGFMFNGATWSYREDIGDNWIFLMNTKHPESLHLNGCYRYLEGRG